MPELTLLVREAVTDIGRLPITGLATRAGLDPHTIDVETAAILSDLREYIAEETHTDDELPATVILEAVEIVLGDAELPDSDEAALYQPLLRLACALADQVSAARADECRSCRGTGEIWFDVEDSTGRVVEDMCRCNCGA
jgi:hypothetical protein